MDTIDPRVRHLIILPLVPVFVCGVAWAHDCQFVAAALATLANITVVIAAALKEILPNLRGRN